MYDLIIVGCGPAGMTAAIYALRDGKKVLILEKETIGGKISSSPLVQNYPGFQKISGAELSDKLYEQVLNLGGTIEIEEVLKIVPGEIKRVITDENEYEARAIILASGSKYRHLEIESEEDYIGNGISFCTICDGAFYKGRDVAVVGGANSAIVNTLALSEICNKVYLIVRKEELRGAKEQIDELKAKENVQIIYNANVVKLLGDDELEKIVIDKNGTLEEISVDGMFLSVGQIPEVNYVNDELKLSNDHYIKSNEDCQTNLDGIFVAGDVRDKKIRQLTTAVNDGTIAALNAIEYLKNKA